ncbi:unnamed protein product [Arabis nemorensis]|uniref:Uncharacterized protein n=1 Tax=Arabis nemorensis TaxID=586526 RepID=A0A565CPW3_9BRAS|nr:unnamed protein product [Arabis nemorensis]
MLDDDMIDEEYDNEQEELPPIDLGSFPNLVPPTMPIGSIPAPLYHGQPVFPYGPRQYGGNGIATNPWFPPYDLKQFMYDGFTSSNELRLDLALENMMLRNQIA